jgi:hypothetical protein
METLLKNSIVSKINVNTIPNVVITEMSAAMIKNKGIPFSMMFLNVLFWFFAINCWIDCPFPDLCTIHPPFVCAGKVRDSFHPKRSKESF